jgi:hypothetical protein
VLRIAILLLVVPVAAEAVYRAVLFVRMWNAAPRDGVFEVFAVGESTMRGADTRPKISIPALVAVMFGNRLGERPVVIHMLAQNGHPLYPQWVALGEATAFRDRSNPGVMLLYSGHNEGDLRGSGPAAVWRPGWYQRVEQWSLVARWIRLSLIEASLVDRRPDFGTYEHELRATIETARAAGLVPIVSTAAGNLSGVEPSFGGRDAEQARASIEDALGEQKDGGCVRTETRCKSRAPADTDIAALLCYEAAKCVQAGGDVARARDLYWEAVELDARHHWGRATRAQNALIRRLTAEYRIPLVDAVALLEAASPSGILGNELFVDGHHPRLMGQVLIARAFAEAISRTFEVPMTNELATERDAMAVFDFTVDDQSASHVLSASWLLGMAAQHPWPNDALTLAEEHARSAIALAPENFTAWLDLAIIQAARRGGILRDGDALKDLGNWKVFFGAAACVPPPDLDAALQRLRIMKADPDVLDTLRRLQAGSCRPVGSVASY